MLYCGRSLLQFCCVLLMIRILVECPFILTTTLLRGHTLLVSLNCVTLSLSMSLSILMVIWFFSKSTTWYHAIAASAQLQHRWNCRARIKEDPSMSHLTLSGSKYVSSAFKCYSCASSISASTVLEHMKTVFIVLPLFVSACFIIFLYHMMCSLRCDGSKPWT